MPMDEKESYCRSYTRAAIPNLESALAWQYLGGGSGPFASLYRFSRPLRPIARSCRIAPRGSRRELEG